MKEELFKNYNYNKDMKYSRKTGCPTHFFVTMIIKNIKTNAFLMCECQSSNPATSQKMRFPVYGVDYSPSMFINDNESIRQLMKMKMNIDFGEMEIKNHEFGIQRYEWESVVSILNLTISIEIHPILQHSIDEKMKWITNETFESVNKNQLLAYVYDLNEHAVQQQHIAGSCNYNCCVVM